MFRLWEYGNLIAFIGARSGCMGKRTHCLSRQVLRVLNSRPLISPLIHTPCYNDGLSQHYPIERSAGERRGRAICKKRRTLTADRLYRIHKT